MQRRRLGFGAAGLAATATSALSARPGPRVSAEELRQFLRAPLPQETTPAIPHGPPHSEADLPPKFTGRYFHDIIILSNKLPRRRASEVLAEGAAAMGGGAEGMEGAEDMDISDGAGAEP